MKRLFIEKAKRNCTKRKRKRRRKKEGGRGKRRAPERGCNVGN
jgi:hypothetical protein